MYTAKIIEKIDNGQGYWNSVKIGIYRGDELVNDYVRNYHSFGESTFAPFERDGKWYALLSKSYVEVCCVTLPDLKVISKTKGGAGGFCPVDIWVPRYMHYDMVFGDSGREASYRIYDNLRDDDEDVSDFEVYVPQEPVTWDSGNNTMVTKSGPFYENFAIYSGCVWGDDSSWKVQAIDISNPKKIKELRPFGYCELANGANIYDIEIDFDGGEYLFNIPVQQRFYWMEDIRDKRYEKYDSQIRLDDLAGD